MSAKLFRCNTYKKQGEGVPNGSLSPRLKEKFWRYVEASAQSSNLFLVQFSFAIQNFRHDTWCSDCRGCGGTDSNVRIVKISSSPAPAVPNEQSAQTKKEGANFAPCS